jgi:hypothetical protein
VLHSCLLSLSSTSFFKCFLTCQYLTKWGEFLGMFCRFFVYDWGGPVVYWSGGPKLCVCNDLSHGTFFFVFLDFRAACTWQSFSKSKGQVISHVMCHVQVMWWIMGLVMWWVRWHVMWWLTHASHAPTWWLSCWLSAKPWWLTAEDAISNCRYAYCSNDSLLMNLVMWLLFSSCIKDCVHYPESPSRPFVVLGLR